jgi:hypothetical protein
MRDAEGESEMRGALAVSTLLAVLGLASPALAVTVRDCDGITDSAANIVEPWEASARSFYQGRVRVASLDTGGEPACCSAHLLILFYGNGDPESFVCRLVSDRGQTGFAGIDFRTLKSSYDPQRGLLLTFGYSVMPPDGGPDAARGIARVRINVSSGAVKAE